MESSIIKSPQMNATDRFSSKRLYTVYTQHRDNEHSVKLRII